jgi:hypothetical protein
VSEKNDGEIQMWERGEIENRNGRKEKREGVGGDARTVRWFNTCGEMRERERRERGEIWSEDGREIDERKMEEERKNREREEWGRVIKTLNMNEYILCLYEIVNRNQKARRANKANKKKALNTGQNKIFVSLNHLLLPFFQHNLTFVFGHHEDGVIQLNLFKRLVQYRFHIILPQKSAERNLHHCHRNFHT